MWIWRIPEVRSVVLGSIMLTAACVALWFLFRILGKGKDLIWMMFWTVVQAAIMIACLFIALFCMGTLMTEFMNNGFAGMFPSVIELCDRYISKPFVYNWRYPVQQLRLLVENPWKLLELLH